MKDLGAFKLSQVKYRRNSRIPLFNTHKPIDRKQILKSPERKLFRYVFALNSNDVDLF